MKTIIIIGINADIGTNLANQFITDGYKVIGTYRKKNQEIYLKQTLLNVI